MNKLLPILLLLIIVSCKPSNEGPDGGSAIDTTNTQLSILTKTLEFSYIKGDTALLQFTTNSPWTIDVSTSGGEAWFKTSSIKGTPGRQSVILTTIVPNNHKYDRRGTITIKAGGKSRILDVVQLSEYDIRVDTKEVDIPIGGGFIEVIIKSNHSYDITINEDDAKWIRRDIILPPKPTRELSPIRERFYITQNNSDYESRSGLIIFSLDSIKDTVTIKQDSRQFYIYVSKPGTLTSLINNAQLGNQVSMKFGGVFNIDDFNLISNKAKKLTYLDLSDLDMEYMPEGALTNLAKTNNNQYIDVVLPNKLKKLPTKAFMDSYIRFVTMPQGLEAIGDMAFNNCWRIETIKMPGSVTDIGLRAFSSSSLSTLIMAEGLINIGPFAFYGCTNLRFVNFSPTVQSIGIEAFTNCNRLISVVLPNSITQIGSGAFRGCTSLKLAQLPESIEELPDRIFESCMYMTEVNIPKSVKTIGKYAFIDCGSLSSITIPQGVTQIGAEAFNSCRRIKEIVIPQSTISIGEYAFWQCTDLKSVTIMSNLTAIEIETFYRCESLTDVNIPATVSSIGAKAFYACSDLEQITIPASVENIDEAAFYGTSQLKRITILATTPPKLNFVSYPPFGQLLSGREFRVPAASLQAYKNDPYWSYYASELVAL